jgi:hypothetical protein
MVVFDPAGEHTPFGVGVAALAVPTRNALESDMDRATVKRVFFMSQTTSHQP